MPLDPTQAELSARCPYERHSFRYLQTRRSFLLSLREAEFAAGHTPLYQVRSSSGTYLRYWLAPACAESEHPILLEDYCDGEWMFCCRYNGDPPYDIFQLHHEIVEEEMDVNRRQMKLRERLVKQAKEWYGQGDLVDNQISREFADFAAETAGERASWNSRSLGRRKPNYPELWSAWLQNLSENAGE